MNRDGVNAAIESADKALHDEGLSWIKKSSLLMRAYYLGVYGALESVADERDLKGLLLRTFTATVFPRSGDDTFPSQWR